MSEQTPQLSPEATRNVDNAFDPERRKGQAEWDAYLDSRPYEENGKVKNPETGKKIKDTDKYFDKKREKHFEGSTKAYENMTPYELTYKIAEAKFNGDKTTERSLYDALLDKIDQEENKPEDERNLNPQRDNRNLYVEYDHRINEIFQRLHENEQAQNPDEQNEEDAAREAILNRDNVAALRAELAGDESDDSEVTPIVPVDPIPPTDPSEVVDGNETPGTDLVVREPMPADPAEREGWFRRNRTRIIAGVAIVAAGAALSWAALSGNNNKDNQRSGSDEKTEQPAKSNGNEFKSNDSFSHPDLKTGPGFELGDSAPEAIDQLKQNFKHHPVLLAEAVYAYQNGISVDKARSHVDEINKMAKSFIADGHLTSEGQDWANKLGKSLDNGSAHWVTQNEMRHSTWFNSGIEEKGQFDKFSINDEAGFNAKKILRITMGNGKVIYLKYNCQNFLWYQDNEESRPSTSTTTESGSTKITLDGRVKFNPWEWKNKDEDEGKGEVKVDHEGTADTGGVRSTGPGAEKPHQDAGAQTQDQANEQTGGGSQGSTNPAEGADQGPKPSTPNDGASGETSSGTVNEQG